MKKLKNLWLNFINHKLFYINGIILFTFILFLFGSTYPLVTFNQERSFLYNAKKGDINYISLVTDKGSNGMNYADLERINNELGMKGIIDAKVSSSKDLIDYGFEFYDGYEEITDSGVYISKTYIEHGTRNIYYDKECTKPVEESITNEELTGTYIKGEHPTRICGVYKGAHSDLGTKYTSINNVPKSNNNTLSNTLGYDISINDIKIDDVPCKNEVKGIVVGKDAIYNDTSALDEEGCYIPISLYNMLFNEENDFSYYYNEKDSSKPLNSPSHIGEEIKLKLQRKDYCFVEKTYKVMGIYDAIDYRGITLKNIDEFYKYSSNNTHFLAIYINGDKFNDLDLLVNKLKEINSEEFSSVERVNVHIDYKNGKGYIFTKYIDPIFTLGFYLPATLVISSIALFVAVICYILKQSRKHSLSFSSSALGTTAIFLIACAPATIFAFFGARALEAFYNRSDGIKYPITPEGCYGYLVALGIVVLGFIIAYVLYKLLPKLKKNHTEIKENN